MAVLRVLVFGSTGTGKTSLCNALTGKQMPANNSARGVTFQSFEFPGFEHDSRNVIITDTVGLNEHDKGHINPAKAAEQLAELIKRSETGYHLLIHVMRGPRITNDHSGNYKLFVKTLNRGRTPCLLVVTGCETSDPLSSWADENKPEFEKQGFDYQEIIATCFASGGSPRMEGEYARLREESRTAVLAAIIAHADRSAEPWYTGESDYLAAFKRAWNLFCELMNLPGMTVVVEAGAYAGLTAVGVPPAMAKVLAASLKAVARKDLLDEA